MRFLFSIEEITAKADEKRHYITGAVGETALFSR